MATSTTNTAAAAGYSSCLAFHGDIGTFTSQDLDAVPVATVAEAHAAVSADPVMVQQLNKWDLRESSLVLTVIPASNETQTISDKDLEAILDETFAETGLDEAIKELYPAAVAAPAFDPLAHDPIVGDGSEALAVFGQDDDDDDDDNIVATTATAANPVPSAEFDNYFAQQQKEFEASYPLFETNVLTEEPLLPYLPVDLDNLKFDTSDPHGDLERAAEEARCAQAKQKRLDRIAEINEQIAQIRSTLKRPDDPAGSDLSAVRKLITERCRLRGGKKSTRVETRKVNRRAKQIKAERAAAERKQHQA